MQHLYYVNRLDSLIQPLVTQTLYVTHYGSPVDINVKVSPVNYETMLPLDGVVADHTVVSSGSSGLANVTFSLSATIPFPRQYAAPPCNDTFLPDDRIELPIESQVSFCKTDDGVSCDSVSNTY